MDKEIFDNCDGEMLLVVQLGKMLITTELGQLLVEPNIIVVLPRGIKFKIDLFECQECRG